MALFITSLNSGSNGNCYYVGNRTEAVLIDAGISCREIEKRMKRLGLNMQAVKAVFISHEHSDHIRGIHTLIKKYQVPVYATPLTASASGIQRDYTNLFSFSEQEEICIGNLHIQAFRKCHDACDPHSFVVRQKDVHVGIFTDIGNACENVIRYFQRCHAIFLESNYDDEMLESSNYPYFLKQRIRGGHGHLSNMQALEIVRRYRPQTLSYLILSHLSKNNNCPQLVESLFKASCPGLEIIVASREEETPVFFIASDSPASPLSGTVMVQQSLF